MKTNIDNLRPEPLWFYFNELTKIPRPSGHEKAVVDYLASVAENMGLWYARDDAGNILVRKNAVSGRENSPKVILQAHVDMVPQKNENNPHNFLTDPIKTYIRDGWVYAEETTLGADNGIGVAAMLSILGSTDIQHGPLETLFTVSEETGMDGAFGLQQNFIQSEILLNLDSEEEGELIIGCAGGVDACISWKYKTRPTKEGQFFKIRVTGLRGGHSGMDINLCRGNANKILTSCLIHLKDGIGLCSFKGGNLRNAIPREAEAIVCVSEDHVAVFKAKTDEITNRLKSNFIDTDPGLTIAVEKTTPAEQLIVYEDQQRILQAIEACPNGAIGMSEQLAGIVETSTNLAIVDISAGSGKAQCMLRSSVNEAKEKLAKEIEKTFAIINATTRFEGNYPGWNPDSNSYILKKAKECYQKRFGVLPQVSVIHAGLECGIIGDKFPGLDMISFGPTIKHPHSPGEKVNIESVTKFWDYLKDVLEKL